MENELVNTAKNNSKKLEERILDAIYRFQEKGINKENLSTLTKILGSAQEITMGTTRFNAEKNMRDFYKLDKEANKEINKLEIELSKAPSKAELKAKFKSAHDKALETFKNLRENNYTLHELQTLVSYCDMIRAGYYEVTDENTYLMNKKLATEVELLNEEVKRLQLNKLDDTIQFTMPAEEANKANIDETDYTESNNETDDIAVLNHHTVNEDSSLFRKILGSSYKYIIGGICGAAILAILQTGGCKPNKGTASISKLNGEETQEVDDNTNTANFTLADAEDINGIGQEITPEPEQQAPALNPGEYGTFVDITNDEQVHARAKWYYDKYLKDTESLANAPTLEDIENDIRMYNGEFKKDSYGKVTFNEQNIIETCIDMHTIANYDSLQYNEKLQFTPLAPLFIDGSLAQKGAQDLDNLMEKVVDAINKEDDMAFVEASKQWGTAVLNMFEYVDFNGEYVNYSQVDAPTSFALYHAMKSKYASTILEYGEEHAIDICIPYCEDFCTGVYRDKALSDILYDLENRCIDAVAVRSGHLAEYEANNLSLVQDLLAKAKSYFYSKYELEVGQSRSLK